MKIRVLFYSVFVFFLFCAPWAALNAAGAGSESGKSPEGEQVRAFIYHHFGKEDRYPSTSVSVSQFEDHLQYLSDNDYTVMTLGEALDILYSDSPLPAKTAVLTMDDAYKSIMENAVPVLEKYGYKATVFAPTSHIGGSNYLSWQQLEELDEKGFEIANHSHSHEYFLNHPEGEVAERFEEDLEMSHALFKKHLDMVPDLYAYPFGEYHPGIIDVLKKHGYRAAAAQKSGVIYQGGDRFLLPRFPMNVNYGKMESFKEKISMNALGVVKTEPENPVVSKNNPPELRITVKNSEVNLGSVQCFVSGQPDCKVETSEKNGAVEIRVNSEKKLASRRPLYTVTAPSRDGSEWFWYSYLWIMPEYGE
ncbi:MAG: polysaccharide deacetylase family protein [Desulfobacterales bacterium]